MKKHYTLLTLLLFVLSCQSFAQNVVAGKMNEVFSRTILSGNAVLTTPWEITYGPDDSLWITDAKTYKVYKMSPVTAGAKRLILDLGDVTGSYPGTFNRVFSSSQSPWPQGGLAGLAIHPDFNNTSTPKKYVYISYIRKYDSASATGNGGYFFKNSVVRFTYNTTTGLLETPVALCDTLPGSSDHNSQRMIIAPVAGVNYLFYGSGDMGAGQLSSAKRVNHAQDTTFYQGKILRFNLETDGDVGAYDPWIPNDNPYNGAKQSAVWAMGVRNNQGFAYDSVRDILYGSSHGPYSDDEVNIIQRKKNYGHPLVIGYAADHNYDGASAGAYNVPLGSSSLTAIVDEAAAAAAIPNYKDPLLSAYPSTQYVIDSVWQHQPCNCTWPSEAWSGLGLYNYSAIPGWKNSLLMAGLKWGRMIRTRLDNTGAATLPSGTMSDTVAYFDGTPRYRDMAFGPGGKDIYITTDNSDSYAYTTNNATLSSCFGCVQKFTFLGYNTVSGTSSISNLVPIASGKPNICEDANTVTINTANSNTNLWVPITDTSGNIVAELNANGNNLGTVTTSVYSNGASAIREQAGTKTLYLDRNVTITPQTQPSSAVSVRIYLNTAEFTALKNGVNSASQPSGVNLVTDLSLFKNSNACGSAISGAAPRLTTTNQASFGGGGYVLQADVSSFSTFYIAGTTSLLPVHLVSFNGSLNGSIAQLQWVTENEQGTKNFSIDRSVNGRDFYSLGSVAATGTEGKITYNFADSAVTKLSSAIVYYRLKMIDADGKFSYSDIIKLYPGTGKAAINVRPNPVINEATVEVAAVVTEKASWQLTDITGKTVMQRPVSLNKGSNVININIGSLPAGTYYLKVSGNNINQSIKLQKL